MPKVYNKRNKDYPKDAVYVGRPTKWGNPFKVGRDGGHAEVVSKYRESLGEVERREIKLQLAGKDLLCWCSPLPCHAEVLLEIANQANIE